MSDQDVRDPKVDAVVTAVTAKMEHLDGEVDNLADDNLALSVAKMFETEVEETERLVRGLLPSRTPAFSWGTDPDIVRVELDFVELIEEALDTAAGLPEPDYEVNPAAKILEQLLETIQQSEFWAWEARREAGMCLLRLQSGITGAEVLGRAFVQNLGKKKDRETDKASPFYVPPKPKPERAPEDRPHLPVNPWTLRSDEAQDNIHCSGIPGNDDEEPVK